MVQKWSSVIISKRFRCTFCVQTSGVLHPLWDASCAADLNSSVCCISPGELLQTHILKEYLIKGVWAAGVEQGKAAGSKQEHEPGPAAAEDPEHSASHPASHPVPCPTLLPHPSPPPAPALCCAWSVSCLALGMSHIVTPASVPM